MSLASEELSDRIRSHLGAHPHVTEQKMFGGRCFMLDGNMLVGPTKDGGMLVRVGKDRYQHALALPGARPMIMGARTMSGFIEVTGDGGRRRAARLDRARAQLRRHPAGQIALRLAPCRRPGRR
jgi:hypothetical protein